MTEANDYDFEKIDDSLKCFKGVLVESLAKVRVACFVSSDVFAYLGNMNNWSSLCLPPAVESNFIGP